MSTLVAGLCDIGADVARRILSMLTLRDVATMSNTNQFWACVVASEDLWKEMYERDFKTGPLSPRTSWRALYKHAFMRGAIKALRFELPESGNYFVQWEEPKRMFHTACPFYDQVLTYGGVLGFEGNREDSLRDHEQLFQPTVIFDRVCYVTNRIPRSFEAEVHGISPTPRYGHTAIWTGYGDAVIFGGFDSRGVALNDLVVIRRYTVPNGVYGFTYQLRWVYPNVTGTPPCPRGFHSATLSDNGNLMIVFGGCWGYGEELNDLHVLDLRTWTWETPKVTGCIPSCRVGHAAAFYDDKFWVVGPDAPSQMKDFSRSTSYPLQGLVHCISLETLEWCAPLTWLGNSLMRRSHHVNLCRNFGATTVMGSKLLMLGGCTTGEIGTFGPLGEDNGPLALALDLRTLAWSAPHILGAPSLIPATLSTCAGSTLTYLPHLQQMLMIGRNDELAQARLWYLVVVNNMPEERADAPSKQLRKTIKRLMGGVMSWLH